MAGMPRRAVAPCGFGSGPRGGFSAWRCGDRSARGAVGPLWVLDPAVGPWRGAVTGGSTGMWAELAVLRRESCGLIRRARLEPSRELSDRVGHQRGT